MLALENGLGDTYGLSVPCWLGRLAECGRSGGGGSVGKKRRGGA